MDKSKPAPTVTNQPAVSDRKLNARIAVANTITQYAATAKKNCLFFMMFYFNDISGRKPHRPLVY